MKIKPVIGITMGDPAGIGPEIICKSLLKKGTYDQCNPIVVGDAQVFIAIVRRLGLPLQIHAIQDVNQAKFEFGTIDVFDLNNFKGELVFGKVSSAAGLAAFESIETTIGLAMKKQVNATVTAPFGYIRLRVEVQRSAVSGGLLLCVHELYLGLSEVDHCDEHPSTAYICTDRLFRENLSARFSPVSLGRAAFKFHSNSENDRAPEGTDREH